MHQNFNRMKSLLTSICLFFLTFVTFSQSPLGFNYQSIIRDDAGIIKKNESVSIGFEILDSSQNSIYSETHTTTTNDYGLVNLVIGEGTTSDDFSSIDWSSENYSIKVTYGSEDMGTTKFMSVPYAMSASNGITTTQAEARLWDTIFQRLGYDFWLPGSNFQARDCFVDS